MSKITGYGQTIADLSLELYGEVGHEIEIIQDNNLEDVFEDMASNTTLIIPNIESNEVLDYYKRNTIKPTTKYPEGETFGAYSEGYSEGYE